MRVCMCVCMYSHTYIHTFLFLCIINSVFMATYTNVYMQFCKCESLS